MSIEKALNEAAAAVNRTLDELLPPVAGAEKRVVDAMRYSTMGGGKRIRPYLVLNSALLFDVHHDYALRAAAAVEMLHCYSLVHDDLPAMDNDDLRRGQPTVHKAFDQATAILAGDALLTLAFQVLAQLPGAAEQGIRLVEELASASGTVGGMIGGQVHDLESEGQPPGAALLESIHRAKTGALIRASVRMGAIHAGADPEQLDALSRYGTHVGLAFQIVDDVLDVEASSEQLGKTAGKDAVQQKVTFPAVYGLERSREMAERERLGAHLALKRFDDRAERLRGLADLIVRRRA